MARLSGFHIRKRQASFFLRAFGQEAVQLVAGALQLACQPSSSADGSASPSPPKASGNQVASEFGL